MKKVFWILLIVIICFGILVTLAGLGIGYLTGRAAVPSKAVLVVSFSNGVAENPGPFSFGGNTAFHQVLRALDRVSTDDHVRAVLVYGDSIPLSLAQKEELRDALTAIVDAGKPVQVHFQSMSIGGYSVVPKGAEVIMHDTPGGYVSLAGYYAPQMFFRQLLEDKLGVKMNVVHIGDYKGAGEPFSRDSMSRYLREELTTYLDDLWNNMIDTVPAVRDVRELPFRERLFKGEFFYISPRQAVEEKLVDRLEYRIRLEDAYPSSISIQQYARRSGGGFHFTSSPIALIPAEGQIMMGSGSGSPFTGENMIYSDTLCRTIRNAADDPDVKAIVLRINSPGGSALASELIYQELKRAGEKKPVIASVGSMAASGGYYIACGCDAIFANPSSLVGSIGVVSIIPELTGMMDKVGITVDPVKKGTYSDFLTPFEPMRTGHEALLRTAMLDIYGLFKNRVAEAREMPDERVEELAKGRIYSGKRGHELKLVDEIGGLKIALNEAADRAGLKEPRYRVYSFRKSLLQILAEADIRKSISVNTLFKVPQVNKPLVLEPALLANTGTTPQ